MICHRLTQTDTAVITLPREYTLIWSYPKGGTFCFAIACPDKSFLPFSGGRQSKKFVPVPPKLIAPADALSDYKERAVIFCVQNLQLFNILL